jgi:hypothetical protein
MPGHIVVNLTTGEVTKHFLSPEEDAIFQAGRETPEDKKANDETQEHADLKNELLDDVALGRPVDPTKRARLAQLIDRGPPSEVPTDG